MTQATSLLTDRYELTMLDAALKAGTHDRQCVFECFARRLPSGRRFGVVAGTGRLLELIRDFRFGDAELEYLRSERVVGEEALAWLADYRFRGRITGYREGEVYFPGSPLLTVEAPFADGVILETLILSVLNYDSAVASAAARMVQVAGGRPLAEMGSRRTGERSAVAAARAAFIAGFSATSNLEAGRTWGVPTMGTAAHSFTLLHDTEEQAFRAQVEALGAGTTLLVDTYDVKQGVETAVRVAGPGLGAVRLDSGDLPVLVGEVRAQLDALGATGTRITVTNDLDEHGIAGLAASPVDSYGVGTSLVTGSGAPAAGMVFKLVAHRDAVGQGEWVAVAKRSTGKQSRGGLKGALRRHDARGVASSELVTVGPHPQPLPGDRDLVVTLAEDGEPDPRWLAREGTAAAREHHARVVRDLPAQAFRLRAGDPAIPTAEGQAV
ncbi:nicotinate phosphoribosyltransferase [Clavibacter michiganensis]|uniref:Nicotinate phosphoribosyltransferase n=1 Tax=Clavibacter michiganensis TaxID=28447 RepID=A0A251YKE4_9MICO|nr:nicotinate phosphoribosyltransferase [Clavibacter michiganensis]OUE24726.1 Nicotinate phosphoribosyltransferase pncB1 [Clavibacter michiganensis]